MKLEFRPQPEANRAKQNFHFDAEKSSISEYSEPVYQFYANISCFPRQFRILPISLTQMTQQLIDLKILTQQESLELPLKEIFDRYQQSFIIPIEEIVVEKGQLAIFDGRMFAHDAGKGRMGDLQKGRFVPTKEPDFILALDTIKTGYHEGLYNPDQSIFDDPGSEQWWQIMEQFKKR